MGECHPVAVLEAMTDPRDLVRANPTRWLYPAVAFVLAIEESDVRERTAAEWEAALDRADLVARDLLL